MARRPAERAILVVNAGSSSLKFSVYRIGGEEELTETARGLLDGIGVRPRFFARDLDDDKLEDRTLGDLGRPQRSSP